MAIGARPLKSWGVGVGLDSTLLRALGIASTGLCITVASPVLSSVTELTKLDPLDSELSGGVGKPAVNLDIGEVASAPSPGVASTGTVVTPSSGTSEMPSLVVNSVGLVVVSLSDILTS